MIPGSLESSSSWAFAPPVKHEKLVLTGGAAFPGCARLTCSLDAGWKACATNLLNFSRTVVVIFNKNPGVMAGNGGIGQVDIVKDPLAGIVSSYRGFLFQEIENLLFPLLPF
jgi:hypothetical protein